MKILSLALLASLCACASIHVPEKRFASEGSVLVVAAKAQDGLFSRFTGPLRVEGAMLLPVDGDPVPVTSTVALTPDGINATFQAPQGPYREGDLLFVDWAGDTVDAMRNTGTERLRTISGFILPQLQVALRTAGSRPLGPGGTADVCLKFSRALALPVTVNLQTTAFPGGAMPSSVPVAQGKTRPDAFSTVMAGQWTCPRPRGTGSIGEGPYDTCGITRGVVATVTYGRHELRACAPFTVNYCPCQAGDSCGSPVTVPWSASICEP